MRVNLQARAASAERRRARTRERLLDAAEKLREFIEENKSKLKLKD